ncbi:hypothetical protein MBLNU459_g2717t2 [Dothideomycetes sp. NU459]
MAALRGEAEIASVTAPREIHTGHARTTGAGGADELESRRRSGRVAEVRRRHAGVLPNGRKSAAAPAVIGGRGAVGALEGPGEPPGVPSRKTWRCEAQASDVLAINHQRRAAQVQQRSAAQRSVGPLRFSSTTEYCTAPAPPTFCPLHVLVSLPALLPPTHIHIHIRIRIHILIHNHIHIHARWVQPQALPSSAASTLVPAASPGSPPAPHPDHTWHSRGLQTDPPSVTLAPARGPQAMAHSNNNTSRDDFRSLSGRSETAEPASAAVSASSSRDTSPVTIRQASSTSSIPTLRKQSSATLNAPQPQFAAAGTSPHGSRTASPVRPSVRQDTPQAAVPGRTGTLRSRQNSHDTSPSRPAALSTHSSTVPSAAAIQRALSATSVPQLQPAPTPGSVTEAVSKLPKLQQRPGGAPASGENTPTWPPSPRIKSPPPTVRSRRNSTLSQRKTDPLPGPGPAPAIVVKPSTPSTGTPPAGAFTADGPKDEQLQAPNSKAPSRGPSGPRPLLETVEENTPPAGTAMTQSPAQRYGRSAAPSTFPDEAGRETDPFSISAVAAKPNGRSSDEEKPATIRGKPNEFAELQSKLGESESEGNRSDGRGRKLSSVTPRPKNVSAPKPPYPSLTSAKSRQPEGTRNMTVETETVSSIPQSALNTDRNDSTTEGKKEGLAQSPIGQQRNGPRKASSKADIFEARVASAVDEANSSDSDETFVYESNPPEQQHRSGRHHSRTPSGTSLHSQSEHRHGGLRGGYGGIFQDNHRVAGKRSMKFSNNPYNVLDSPENMGDGTVRAHHARHIGRLGRTGGGSSRASLYDQDSPFTQSSKLRNNLSISGRQTSRPGTPKSAQSREYRPSGLFNQKNDLSQYDFEGEGADDERAPLVGTVRTSRSIRNPRRYNSESMRSIDYYGVQDRSSRMSRFGGCLFGFMVFVLVILGAVGFLVMSNKPLYNFEVSKIQNVLASEQEIMLDLLVGAINPNVLSVSVTDMDINVFAKSKYVSPIKKDPASGSNAARRRRDVRTGASAPWQDEDGHWHDGNGDGVDDGTDPIEGDSQTMLLGRIFSFDAPLTFDGSPLKRHMHYSVGELRLGKPGNKTESGGSERWERVIKYPFELILRGVLKYQLPISSRPQSAAIAATVLVHPEEGVDEHGRMRVEEVDRSEEWQWVEFDDAKDSNGRTATMPTRR